MGFGFTVTDRVLEPEQPDEVMVSVTLTEPGPAVVQFTVIVLVPWPVTMVPPVTVQL